MVSVVIPARDAEAHIGRALRSVLDQEYDGPVEVIVADGSDNDRTGELIRRRFPQVRTVPNPGRSIPAGLNRAIAASGGEIVVRCDSRSVLPPGYVARIVELLQKPGVACAGGRVEPVGRNLVGRAVAMAMRSLLGNGGSAYKAGGTSGPADTVYLGAFRRAALDEVGGYDEGIGANEDYELNWRLRRREGG